MGRRAINPLPTAIRIGCKTGYGVIPFLLSLSLSFRLFFLPLSKYTILMVANDGFFMMNWIGSLPLLPGSVTQAPPFAGRSFVFNTMCFCCMHFACLPQWWSGLACRLRVTDESGTDEDITSGRRGLDSLRLDWIQPFLVPPPYDAPTLQLHSSRRYDVNDDFVLKGKIDNNSERMTLFST